MVVNRRWLVPEVVQTSAMDCGPASLKALLEGFGIPVVTNNTITNSGTASGTGTET